jgi:hypothetical protein
MKQSSGDLLVRTTSQEISNLLRKPKVHDRIHKSPPLDPVLGQINRILVSTV